MENTRDEISCLLKIKYFCPIQTTIFQEEAQLSIVIDFFTKNNDAINFQVFTSELTKY